MFICLHTSLRVYVCISVNTRLYNAACVRMVSITILLHNRLVIINPENNIIFNGHI